MFPENSGVILTNATNPPKTQFVIPTMSGANRRNLLAPVAVPSTKADSSHKNVPRNDKKSLFGRKGECYRAEASSALASD